MLVRSHREQAAPVQRNLAVDHELFQRFPAPGDAHFVVRSPRTEQDLCS